MGSLDRHFYPCFLFGIFSFFFLNLRALENEVFGMIVGKISFIKQKPVPFHYVVFRFVCACVCVCVCVTEALF